MSVNVPHLRPLPPPSSPVSAPDGRDPRRVRPRRIRWYTVGAVAILLAVVVIGIATQRSAPAVPTEAIQGSGLKLAARGQVRPVSQARVGTVEGGVLLGLSVEAGDAVAEQQQIARVRGPLGVEIVTSPIRGTITSVLVHVGDTLLPGTVVVTVGDLSRLQVETTDVDEYIVGSLYRGQQVSMVVEALARQELQGAVRSISLEPRTTGVGDEHYPVVIDLVSWPPELRPGMTAKITFE